MEPPFNGDRFHTPTVTLGQPGNRRQRRGSRSRADKKDTQAAGVRIIPIPTTQEEAEARIRDNTADEIIASWEATNSCRVVDCNACRAARAVIRMAKHSYDLGSAHNDLVDALFQLRMTGQLGNSPLGRALLEREGRALRELSQCIDRMEQYIAGEANIVAPEPDLAPKRPDAPKPKIEKGDTE